MEEPSPDPPGAEGDGHPPPGTLESALPSRAGPGPAGSGRAGAAGGQGHAVAPGLAPRDGAGSELSPGETRSRAFQENEKRRLSLSGLENDLR